MLTLTERAGDEADDPQVKDASENFYAHANVRAERLKHFKMNLVSSFASDVQI